MLGEEHGKEFVLGTSNSRLCMACQSWLSVHDGWLAHREIVHYQHTLAEACCVLLVCT
jgi:hypothetical protein